MEDSVTINILLIVFMNGWMVHWHFLLSFYKGWSQCYAQGSLEAPSLSVRNLPNQIDKIENFHDGDSKDAQLG